jgi:N6-L-threonylcarbamoyladenine synthase
MRHLLLLIRRAHLPTASYIHRRNLLTLAIETSCDDTSVAILEKHKNNSATLHFHSKITSDNRQYKGVHPIPAHESHQEHLANLVNEALQSLPLPQSHATTAGNVLFVKTKNGGELRQKPDFVTATRGPGMRASLITGVDTAKGLAVGWQVPFLGVNHMQAHALTPQLISALEHSSETSGNYADANPPFPFLSLLVSGGNTMLVHSKGLCDHQILARTVDIAIGDMIDKCARDILPIEVLESSPDVSYGPVLERYAFPNVNTVEDYGYMAPIRIRDTTRQKNLDGLAEPALSWKLPLPLSSGSRGSDLFLDKKFSFSGLGSSAKRAASKNPSMEDWERRLLAREIMRMAFEHLASRVLLALQGNSIGDISALVVSGGVASNQYLKHITRSILDKNDFENLPLMFPPLQFCTDNAAMIAWTGIEMWEAGYRTNLDAMAMRDWSIDPGSTEPVGILQAPGWRREVVV